VTSDAALEVSGLTKAFGGVHALDHVDLRVDSGQILALLGQNGSGKSTLVKCLTGVYTPDAGSVRVFGEELGFPATAPHTHGIAVIHQDVGMVDSLTVMENLGVSVGYGRRHLLGVIRERAERDRFGEIMDRVGVRVPLDVQVGELSPAERSLLAVVRAVRLMEDSGRAPDRQVFILDEPTAALSGPEAERVLDLAGRMATLGAGVVLISHRIAEVKRVADALTVLRGGRGVYSGPVSAMSRGEIVAAMLGRTMDDFYPEPPPLTTAAPRMVVDDVSTSRLHNISFTAAKGEVLGITGLAGMGQEELPRVLVGAVRPLSGRFVLDGEEVGWRGPRHAIARGIGLVPADRLRDGCWADGTAGENVTLPALGDVAPRGVIDDHAELARARALMNRFGVRPPDPHQQITRFSGGNQQKVVFAKWVQLAPDVLLLDEPTQGVDPGAARELLDEAIVLARGGTTVLVFSGDHEQIAAICHRVIVLQHGRVAHEILAGDLSEAAVLSACEAEPASMP
jgi:ribose transport system ATP-binding protein